jgi:hypothetical protein
MNFEAILKAKDGVTTTFQNKFVVSKNTLYISKDPGLVVSWSLVKKIGETLGLVKLMLARKLQPLVVTLDFC